MAWREPGDQDKIGVVDLDWQAGRITILAEASVASRAHGILALPDGGFVAVASRPGRWLLRADAQGRVAARVHLPADPDEPTNNGHAALSADGRRLFCAETDPASGAGRLAIRDAITLELLARQPSHGVDPHQLLLTPDGRTLLVAHGGIARDRAGRKHELHRMAPELTALSAEDGRVTGRWTLPDARLSLRHLAWQRSGDGAAGSLGVALQAEHDDPRQRREAPVLALWDGRSLRIAAPEGESRGYAGDIAAAAGGWVLSAQKSDRALWWPAARGARAATVGALAEPCALAALPDGEGVLIAARRGVARWHLREAPQMLAWPRPLLPDNHAALLGSA